MPAKRNACPNCYPTLEANTMKLGILAGLCLSFSFLTTAQERFQPPRLSETQFVSLARHCAPGVPPDTLLAIARTESGLYTNAISINRPRTSARRAGYRDGEIILARQPRNRMQAARWVHWLEGHHFTVSVGLMQVNLETSLPLRVGVEQLLDPCTNLRLGASILVTAYSEVARQIGEGFDALDVALSIYNSGSPTGGFRNGYVEDVYLNAPKR